MLANTQNQSAIFLHSENLQATKQDENNNQFVNERASEIPM